MACFVYTVLLGISGHAYTRTHTQPRHAYTQTLCACVRRPIPHRSASSFEASKRGIRPIVHVTYTSVHISEGIEAPMLCVYYVRLSAIAWYSFCSLKCARLQPFYRQEVCALRFGLNQNCLEDGERGSKRRNDEAKRKQ